MKKILSLVLLISLYLFTIGCARTEGQQKKPSAPTKTESTKTESTQNQSVQNKDVQSEPVAVKKGQARIAELAAQLGLQSIRPVAFVDFELSDLTGQKQKLSSYKGKLIFLNFWATWCPPCKAEMPDMQKLYENFKNKNFQMIAVDLRESKQIVATFMKNKGFNFPVLLDSKGEAGRTYGAENIPLSILINKKGTLIYGAMGARPWADPEAIELINLLIDQPE